MQHNVVLKTLQQRAKEVPTEEMVNMQFASIMFCGLMASREMGLFDVQTVVELTRKFVFIVGWKRHPSLWFVGATRNLIVFVARLVFDIH